MRVILNRLLCLTILGLVTAFLLAARDVKPFQKSTTVVVLFLLGGSAYFLWFGRYPHWSSWAGAGVLLVPFLLIADYHYYRITGIHITSFDMGAFRASFIQIEYSAVLFAGLIVRTLAFVYVCAPDRCWSCGYPRRGLPGPNCPECGKPLDSSRPYIALERRRWTRPDSTER